MASRRFWRWLTQNPQGTVQARLASFIAYCNLKMRELEGYVNVQQGSAADLDQRLTQAESDLTALDGRVTTAEGDIVSLDGRVAAIEGERGLAGAWRSVTTATTITADDGTVLGDATGGAFSVTLPPAASVPARIFVVKKIDASANAVTIDGDGAETIDGAATLVLAAQWASAMVQSDGSAWYVLAS